VATGGVLRFGEVFLATDGGALWNNVRSDEAARDGWASLYGGVRIAARGMVAELSASRALDTPVGAPRQDRTRVWFRGAVKY
jgi:hypothetical protein